MKKMSLKGNYLTSCLLIVIMFVNKVQSAFNFTAYEVLPPVFTLDEYDICMKTRRYGSNNAYCVVYADIVPNDTIHLWHHIKAYSSDYRHHLKHDRVFRGLCLERCRKTIAKLNKEEMKGLYVGEVQDEELNKYYERLYQSHLYKNYEEILGICINSDFSQQYGLKLRTKILYCQQTEKPLAHDALDYSFYWFLASIILLNIGSTLYDYLLKRNQSPTQQTREFYQNELKSKGLRILTSFSLVRNYYRLTLRSKSAASRELRFFEGFRAISVVLILFGHMLIMAIGYPIANLHFIEGVFHSFFFLFVINSTAMIQIFFVISGFLLYLSFMKNNLVKSSSTVSHCFRVFTKQLLSRYLRLTPSLALLLFFIATVFQHLQNGPLWNFTYSQSDRINAREYWWKNIFYVNNFYMSTSSELQTWYLAADMQLYVFYSIVLILLSKFPHFRNFIYGTLGIMVFAVPGLCTYFQNLDATFHLYPETFRYFFFKDSKTFTHSYVPFYMNLGGYFFGVLLGEVYLRRKKSTKIRNYHGHLKYELSWTLILSGFLLVIAFGSVFISSRLVNSPIGGALYAACYRNIWSILCTLLIFGMIYNVGWIILQFLRLPFFSFLGKLSYQAYLWHIVVIHFQVGFIRIPIYANFMVLTNLSLSTYLLTNIIAFIIALTFEYPLSSLFRSLLLSSPHSVEHEENKCVDQNNEKDVSKTTDIVLK